METLAPPLSDSAGTMTAWCPLPALSDISLRNCTLLSTPILRQRLICLFGATTVSLLLAACGGGVGGGGSGNIRGTPSARLNLAEQVTGGGVMQSTPSNFDIASRSLILDDQWSAATPLENGVTNVKNRSFSENRSEHGLAA